MIELTRAQARHLKGVLRKCLPPGAPRGTRPRLSLHAGPDGLRVRARLPEVAAECHLPGSRQTDLLALPGAALDDFEGAGEGTVRLERTAPGVVQARWADRGVPQARDYPEPDEDGSHPFPSLPAAWKGMTPKLRGALADAARVASRDGVRYALQRLQLRGRKGEVVATDGRQVLTQSGFDFPWQEDLLVPALGVFGCKEVPPDAPVSVARTEAHVCLRLGAWVFWLDIDRGGRFPAVDNILPAAGRQATTWIVTEREADFLARALPGLPGAGQDCQPVTVDLNGKACVRARESSQGQPTEVELPGSRVQGPAVRFVTGRQYLGRALALGFRSFQVARPDLPVVCRQAHRTYAWMPLGADGAVPPEPDALRVTPEAASQPPTPRGRTCPPTPPGPVSPTPVTGEPVGDRQPQPTTPSGNGADTPAVPNLEGLVEEGLALQADLRGLYRRAARLVAGLRRHRQQSRLVRNTLASLRHLHPFPD